MSTRERHFQPLTTDRPLVLGRIEEMPFKHDSFDFVIACHVLEHSLDVDACLRELQRVARAGYIECPDAFLERINPYKDHRMEITVRDGVLVVKEKKQWVDQPDIVELYEARVKNSLAWKSHLRKRPFEFHARLFWSRETGGIRYVLERNVASPSGWSGGGESYGKVSESMSDRARGRLRDLVRKVLSQTSRNDKLDIMSMLRCQQCKSESILATSTSATCQSCGGSYIRDGNVVRFVS
jgi:SAM-dependent methyltransferase